jgi:hypothetical protein
MSRKSTLEDAAKLARQGLSYRQISKNLGISDTVLRKNPEVRKARLEGDPEAHSQTNGQSVACRIEAAPTLITNIELDLKRILGPMYTLNESDRKRLVRVLQASLEEVL